MQNQQGKIYDSASHNPVMVDEVINYMAPRDGEVYLDGTFGAGGHTRAMLKAADCRVFAIDRDPYVEVFISRMEEEFASRVTFLPGKFSDMKVLLNEQGVKSVDGILLDIGVSSMQIDTPKRGFSFLHDGPLDMRMGGEGENASDFINRAEEEELAGILFKYGGERMSRRIARAIVTARSEEPITKTGQLVDIIKKAVAVYNDKINPATRTFQALRMWVNDELGELKKGLNAAEEILAPHGRLVTITFHSGEDSIVKEFLNRQSGKEQGYSRHHPLPVQEKSKPAFKLITRKAVKPGMAEIDLNPRARSAKLRAAERTDEGQNKSTVDGGKND